MASNFDDQVKEFDSLLKKSELINSHMGPDMQELAVLAQSNFPTKIEYADEMFVAPNAEILANADKNLLQIYSLLQGDPSMGFLKNSVDAIYRKLKNSLQNEKDLIQSCQNKFTDLSICINKVQTAWRFKEENNQDFNNLKNEIVDIMDTYRKFLLKESESKIKAEELKNKLGMIDATYQEEIERISKEVSRALELQKDTRNEFETINTSLLQKMKGIDDEIAILLKETKEEEDKISELKARHDALNTDFIQKCDKINELDKAIIEANNQISSNNELIKELEKQSQVLKLKIQQGEEFLQELNRSIKNQTNEKEAFKEKQADQHHEQVNIEKETIHFSNLKENFESQILGLNTEIAEAEKKHVIIKEALSRDQKAKMALLSEIKNSKDMLLSLQAERDQLTIKNQYARDHLKILEDQFQEESEQIAEDRGNKEDMLNVVKKQQEKIHQVHDMLYTLDREVKTLENKVAGSKNIVKKLNEQAENLKEQQEKYSQETSNAHAKFYQIIEDIKVKNYIIADLQENNKNLSKKLKQQKSLYEAVRNDRNVYQKSLLDMKENMDNVAKEYQSLSHQVNQIKEDIKFKESEITNATGIHLNIRSENENAKQKKAVLKTKIKIQEEQIKANEEELIKLKGLISEAHIEKKRKLNIHDTIINERDMLSLQYFKKNTELQKLIEKIKSLKNFLDLDEKHFAKMNTEMNDNLKTLQALTKRYNQLKELYRNSFPLKQEIIILQKELLYTQAKNAAFEDKLKQPLNIHPWKKLETTDPEKFDALMQINYLQKLLIEKSCELDELETLIKEKESEFTQVKLIAVRAAGKDSILTPDEFKLRIKEKMYSVNQMQLELKEAREKITRLNIEIDIYKAKIDDHEKAYYKMRKQEDRLNADPAF